MVAPIKGPAFGPAPEADSLASSTLCSGSAALGPVEATLFLVGSGLTDLVNDSGPSTVPSAGASTLPGTFPCASIPVEAGVKSGPSCFSGAKTVLPTGLPVIGSVSEVSFRLETRFPDGLVTRSFASIAGFSKLFEMYSAAVRTGCAPASRVDAFIVLAGTGVASKDDVLVEFCTVFAAASVMGLFTFSAVPSGVVSGLLACATKGDLVMSSNVFVAAAPITPSFASGAGAAIFSEAGSAIFLAEPAVVP